jgi:hypothetical protein
VKIKRQNVSESYSTTVGWIKDFSKSLEKNGNFLDSLRSRYYLGNKFNSTEEKMADIKNRVGFDLVGSLVPNDENAVVTAGCSGESSGGNKCELCSSGLACGCSSDEDSDPNKHVELVSSMLNYIESMAENEWGLPGSVMVDKCMSDFGGSESMVEAGLSLDIDKLIRYADALAKAARLKLEKEDGDRMKYAPPDDEAEDGAELAEFSNRQST